MKRLAVIGTREATEQMRRDVTARVKAAVRDGWGIVTGGSTGVDTIAMIAALQHGGDVRVYVPVSLERYKTDLLARAEAGKCRRTDAKETIAVLDDLKAHHPTSLYEPDQTVVLSPEAFYARNELVLCDAAAVAAYHLTGNATASTLRAGTLLTVERAQAMGLPVELKEYLLGDG